MSTQTLNSQLKALVQEIEHATERNLSDYHSTKFEGYLYAANAYNAVLVFLAPLVQNEDALSNDDALSDDAKAEALKDFFLELEQEFQEAKPVLSSDLNEFATKTLSQSFESKSGLHIRIQVQNKPFEDDDHEI